MKKKKTENGKILNANNTNTEFNRFLVGSVVIVFPMYFTVDNISPKCAKIVVAVVEALCPCDI